MKLSARPPLHPLFGASKGGLQEIINSQRVWGGGY